MKSRPDSMLYQTFVAADALRLKALEAGDSREDANAIVAGALKAAWPKGREEPWHYACEPCGDTGWRYHTCPGDATCGRKSEHLGHEYVVYCWCEKGRALQPKARQETDELAALGKVAKPSRFGR